MEMLEGVGCGEEKEHNLAREVGCIERIEGILSLLYNWSQDFPSSYSLQTQNLPGLLSPKVLLSSLSLGWHLAFKILVIFMIIMNITTCPVNGLFQMLRMSVVRKKRKG